MAMQILIERRSLMKILLQVFLIILDIGILIILVSVRHLKAGDYLSFRPSFTPDIRAVHLLEFILMRLCKTLVFTLILGNPMP